MDENDSYSDIPDFEKWKNDFCKDKLIEIVEFISDELERDVEAAKFQSSRRAINRANIKVRAEIVLGEKIFNRIESILDEIDRDKSDLDEIDEDETVKLARLWEETRNKSKRITNKL